MSDIPAFSPAERRIVEAGMIFRYGQLVPLLDAEVELKLDAAREDLTACPGIYWNERGVQFVVCKPGAKIYRSYFYYSDDQQYRIGEQDYDSLEDCIRNLLQLQADHDAIRRDIMSSPALGPDDDYHGPVMI